MADAIVPTWNRGERPRRHRRSQKAGLREGRHPNTMRPRKKREGPSLLGGAWPPARPAELFRQSPKGTTTVMHWRGRAAVPRPRRARAQPAVGPPDPCPVLGGEGGRAEGIFLGRLHKMPYDRPCQHRGWGCNPVKEGSSQQRCGRLNRPRSRGTAVSVYSLFDDSVSLDAAVLHVSR